MKKFIVITFFLLLSLSIFSQALTENPDYIKSLELKAMSEQAYEQGDYDAAYDYAIQSKEYALKAKEYVLKMLSAYESATKLKAAGDRIEYLKAIGSEAKYPEEMKKSSELYDQAKTLYDSEQYNESKQNSEAILALLYNIKKEEPEVVVAVVEPVKPADTVVTDTDAKVLPKYYKVRGLLTDHDCFWRIALKVYGDAALWPKIYEANKDKLKDPSNPNFIRPGMIFEIPSLHGEIREGTFGE